VNVPIEMHELPTLWNPLSQDERTQLRDLQDLRVER
jgi:hypothetical protein